MIVNETVIQQMTVESKLQQIPLQLSTMNRSLHHKGSCKGSKIQNVKLFINHDNRTNLLKKKWRKITING